METFETIIPAKQPNSEIIKTSLIHSRHDAGTLHGHCVALCARLQKRSPQGRWRNRSESHVEKHRKRSFGAPLGSFWVSLGSIAGPFVSFGVPLGDPSGLLWNPLGLLRGSFGAPWGNPSGVLWGVLWSFGIPLGTKGGPSGKQMRPSGAKWEPNESKC